MRRFHVLLALAAGPCDAAEIARDTERTSGGTVQLKNGTLYRILALLLAKRLIREHERRRGQTATSYELTDRGWRAARADAASIRASLEAYAKPLTAPPSDR